MAEVICKYNQFGHCKFGKHCYFKHITEICGEDSCEINKCTLRHPKDCRYIVRNKICKFDELCAFNHDVINQNVENKKEEKKLKEKLIT